MKLYPHLKPELIKIECENSKTEEILYEMVHELKLRNKIDDEDMILEKLMEREKLGSTSIGNHSAVPHAKLKNLKEPIIFIGTSKQGVRYHESDEEPVHFIILILSPSNSPIVHLQILAAAASLIKKSKKSMKEFLSAKTADELINIIKQYETRDDQE